MGKSTAISDCPFRGRELYTVGSWPDSPEHTPAGFIQHWGSQSRLRLHAAEVQITGRGRQRQVRSRRKNGQAYNMYVWVSYRDRLFVVKPVQKLDVPVLCRLCSYRLLVTRAVAASSTSCNCAFRNMLTGRHRQGVVSDEWCGVFGWSKCWVQVLL